jgi:hypothetical protein
MTVQRGRGNSRQLLVHLRRSLLLHVRVLLKQALIMNLELLLVLLLVFLRRCLLLCVWVPLKQALVVNLVFLLVLLLFVGQLKIGSERQGPWKLMASYRIAPKQLKLAHKVQRQQLMVASSNRLIEDQRRQLTGPIGALWAAAVPPLSLSGRARVVEPQAPERCNCCGVCSGRRATRPVLRGRLEIVSGAPRSPPDLILRSVPGRAENRRQLCWGLSGPLLPQNLLEKVGAKPPTLSNGF